MEAPIHSPSLEKLEKGDDHADDDKARFGCQSYYCTSSRNDKRAYRRMTLKTADYLLAIVLYYYVKKQEEL
jgi:hypothetical protein